MENKCGLKKLVFYDSLIGNTYFVWNLRQKIPKFKKYYLILWNIFIFLLFSIQLIIGLKNSFSTESKSHYFRPDLTKYKTVLPHILFSILYFSYGIQTLVIFLFLVIRGHKILDVLNEEEVIKLNNKYEKKIGFILALMKFIISSTSVTIVTILLYVYYGIEYITVTLFIFFPIVYFLSMNTHLAIITFILYKSLIVSKQLKTISNMKDMKLMFDMICKIQNSVERLDALVNLVNLFELAMDSLLCISSLCIFAIVPNEYPANSFSHMTLSLSKISSLCLICDMIPKQFNKLLKELKDRFRELNENKSSSEQLFNHMLKNQLNEMKDEMCFTAFNLFKLNANTLLSCIALIISYSIVIIQTNQSEPYSINEMNCTGN